MKSSLNKAVLIIVLAIFLFDVQGVFIKHMGARFPVEQIAFFRNLFGILPFLVALGFASEWRAAGKPWKINRWQLGIGRGVLLICAQMFFYYALINMEFATATTLAFSGPLFITLFSIPLLGHKVGLWRAFAVCLGFSGVAMVMKPGSDAFGLVALLPIGAAVFYALASLSARFFDANYPTALISIYASVGAMISAGAIVLFTGNWVAFSSVYDWFWFIGMGAAGGCAVLFLITAYRMTDPSSLSPFEYFGIPFSFFLGWIFFDERPFDALFPGVLFIVGGGLLVFWREHRLKTSEQ